MERISGLTEMLKKLSGEARCSINITVLTRWELSIWVLVDCKSWPRAVHRDEKFTALHGHPC